MLLIQVGGGGSKVETGTHRFTVLATRYSDSILALWQTKGREVHSWLWEAWSFCPVSVTLFAQKSKLLISSYFPCMCFRIKKSSDSEMSREQALTALEDSKVYSRAMCNKVYP